MSYLSPYYMVLSWVYGVPQFWSSARIRCQTLQSVLTWGFHLKVKDTGQQEKNNTSTSIRCPETSGEIMGIDLARALILSTRDDWTSCSNQKVTTRNFRKNHHSPKLSVPLYVSDTLGHSRKIPILTLPSVIV